MAPPLEDSLAGVSCLEGVPVSPRRWHTGVAPQALQRRFCVPSMTILYWWSREYALEMGLEGVGCAIVLGGREDSWIE